MPLDTTNSALTQNADQATHGASSLSIHVVERIDADQSVTLNPSLPEGCSALFMCAITPADVGQLLVVQTAAHATVVLGKLSQLPTQLVRPINRAFSLQANSNDEPLVFQAGKSRLELLPHGKIRLVSDDVQLRARRHMDIRGAWIDLN